MKESQIRDFTHGKITRQLITFAWPLLMANMLQIFYNMVDLVVVGHAVGKSGTSAVAVGGDVVLFLSFIAMGFSSAGQVLIAQYIGSKSREKIGKFVGTMFGFLMLCSILISIFAIVFQGILLKLMNTPSEAYAGALSYSTICIVGLVFIYGYNIVSSILRGMGDSKHPLIFIGIATVINVFLDILLVIKFGMGAGGAALATVISQATSFIACAIFLFKQRKAFELDIRPKDFLFWNKGMLEDLVKLGAPMAIKIASVQISRLALNSWINSFGVIVSAFSGIASKIYSGSNLIANAMSVAGSTMVGQNIAAREYNRVKVILLKIAYIMIIIAIILSATFILFPNSIFQLFTSDQAVLNLAKPYVPIAIIVFFAASSRAVMNSLINGSGNHRINFVTAILDAIIIRIGLALLFGVTFGMKHYGFWLGDALAGFTPFFLGLGLYLSGKWKKIKQNT